MNAPALSSAAQPRRLQRNQGRRGEATARGIAACTAGVAGHLE
jgi:hypothetical protein